MRILPALLALALAAFRAHAADGPLRRFALVAGASQGGPERTPLRYAISDARAVSRVFRRLGGVALADLVLLEEPVPDRIRTTLATIAAAAARERGAGRRVEVFLYYSGHSDEEGLLLGSSRLAYGELRRLLDDVPADVRVAILDSCASGAFTRAKGGIHRPPFLLDESSSVKGHAFLTSSAANEAALESDRLRGSFFTHALVTGLRGAADANADGVVTLNEAYQFAFRETLAVTEATRGGPQHATYDIGLVGSGEVVMTDLRGADALLVLPESLDGRVFVRDSAGHLVAELRKTRGTRIDLALEEGRYEVRLVRDRGASEGAYVLHSGGTATVDEARLAGAPVEATVARGSDDPPREAPRPEWPTVWMAARGGPAFARAPQARTGADVELAAGLWLRRMWGTELAAGYQRISGTKQARLQAFDLKSGFYDVDGEVEDVVSSYVGTLTFKVALPTYRVRPYLLGGVGLYLSAIDRTAKDPSATLAPDSWGINIEFHPAVHAGAGLSWRFGRHAFTAVEARYVWGKPGNEQLDLVENTLHVSAGLGVELF